MLKFYFNLKQFWLKQNTEGIRLKDAVLVPIIVIGMILILCNLALWIVKPEQSWIGNFLFPFK